MMNQPSQGIYNNNIVSIGGLGYNNTPQYYNPSNNPYMNNPQYNTYYNNMGYYNPYLERMKMEQYQIQLRNQMIEQADIYKRLCKLANRDKSPEELEILLSQYDIPDNSNYLEVRQEQLEYEKHCKFTMMNLYPEYYTPDYNQGYINAINMEIARVREKYPDDMSLGEWLERSGELITENMIRESQRRVSNLNNLYDSNRYRSLVDSYSHPGQSYFDSLFKQPTTIDDMEVKLPYHMRDEFVKKRQDFMESILKGG